SWLEHMQEKEAIHDGTVRLYDVAKGMIQFSSNANTEYLLAMLGLLQINNQLAALGMDQHEEIYYISSSFLIPAYLNMEEFLSPRKVERKMKHMRLED